MSVVYSPVFSQKTGWILGVIDNHTARPLTHDEVAGASDELNRRAAPSDALSRLNEKLRVALEEKLRPERGVNFGDYETMAEWVDQVREKVFGPFPDSMAHLSEDYAKEKAALTAPRGESACQWFEDCGMWETLCGHGDEQEDDEDDEPGETAGKGGSDGA